MVNNSTNINKTNNHLSPKESLNSDGQLFHQYQPMSIRLSHEIIEQKKKTMTYAIRNLDHGLGQAHKCGKV